MGFKTRKKPAEAKNCFVVLVRGSDARKRGVALNFVG
jgi:hypothetical protein